MINKQQTTTREYSSLPARLPWGEGGFTFKYINEGLDHQPLPAKDPECLEAWELLLVVQHHWSVPPGGPLVSQEGAVPRIK